MNQYTSNNNRSLQMAAFQILGDAFKGAAAGRVQKGWSVQGMGMLRLHIGESARLHVWDRSLEYCGVSRIHNHGWDLKSTIVVGTLVNTVYNLKPTQHGAELLCYRQRLVTGFDCAPVNEPEAVSLYVESSRLLVTGEVYAQKAAEIHNTDSYTDGTVTLVEREDAPGGEADVFWLRNASWGTAKPRQATMAEIARTTARALSQLATSINAG